MREFRCAECKARRFKYDHDRKVSVCSICGSENITIEVE